MLSLRKKYLEGLPEKMHVNYKRLKLQCEVG
jgi:hypothetical protein